MDDLDGAGSRDPFAGFGSPNRPDSDGSGKKGEQWAAASPATVRRESSRPKLLKRLFSKTSRPATPTSPGSSPGSSGRASPTSEEGSSPKKDKARPRSSTRRSRRRARGKEGKEGDGSMVLAGDFGITSESKAEIAEAASRSASLAAKKATEAAGEKAAAQRYFRIPLRLPDPIDDTQTLVAGHWLAHFVGQKVVRQIELVRSF